MIPKIIIGTAQFGINYGINNKTGVVSDKEISSILQLANKNGIFFYDTAADYGNSEEVLGKYIKEQSRAKIITKFSKKEGISIEQSLVNSIHLLGNKIDTVMFHSYNAYLDNINNIDKIKELLADNGISNLGVSIYTNEEGIELSKDTRINTIQLPFNLLDNNNQRGRLIELLKNNNKTIHTRSVFLQGLFFMENNVPSSLSPIIHYIEQLKEIAREKNKSIASLALQYVLMQENIDGVLIGIDNSTQFANNINDSLGLLDSDTLMQIEKINVENTDLLNPSKWHL